MYLVHKHEGSFEGTVHIFVAGVCDAATLNLFPSQTKIVIP